MGMFVFLKLLLMYVHVFIVCTRSCLDITVFGFFWWKRKRLCSFQNLSLAGPPWFNPIYSFNVSPWTRSCWFQEISSEWDICRVAALFGGTRESSKVRSVTRTWYFFRSPKRALHRVNQSLTGPVKPRPAVWMRARLLAPSRRHPTFPGRPSTSWQTFNISRVCQWKFKSVPLLFPASKCQNNGLKRR